jgi:hypothetical protein
MNLNAMKVKELNARKSNNAKDLRKKLSSQKVRAGVLNHQFISSVKWTQLKSCMLTGKLEISLLIYIKILTMSWIQ